MQAVIVKNVHLIHFIAQLYLSAWNVINIASNALKKALFAQSVMIL